MVNEFKSKKEFKKYLEEHPYEKKNMHIVEKELDDLWNSFKINNLFLNFTAEEGHKAFCYYKNTILLAHQITRLGDLTTLAIEHKLPEQIKNIPVELLIVYGYTAYLEIIANMFKIIINIPLLVGKERKFYSAPEIIDALEDLLETPEIFRFINRDIRNVLTHHDFCIYNNSLIYNTKKVFKKEYEQKILDFGLLIDATMNLNRLFNLLNMRIEKRLAPFFNIKKFDEDVSTFSEECENIKKKQIKKDSIRKGS